MEMPDKIKLKWSLARQNGAYIYGNGTFAEKILELLPRLEIGFRGFVDYRNDSTIRSQTSRIVGSNSSPVVLLGFHNYQANINEIVRKLEKEDIEIISVIDFAQILACENIHFENYWLTNNFDIYSDNSNVIDLVISKLADRKSKDLFVEILNYRQSGDLDELTLKDNLETQYFPIDLPWLLEFKERPINVLDGGAYRGETLDYFKCKCKIGEWVFVEPDKNNIDFILEKSRQHDGKFRIIENPLYSEICKKFFNSDINSHGSQLTALGSLEVVTTTIDEIFSDGKNEVNFIKLDIEGSELAALIGGLNTIERCRPYLAISIYHKPEDHWLIPQFISKKFPFYNMHIRLHGEQTFDCVLYCIPA